MLKGVKQYTFLDTIIILYTGNNYSYDNNPIFNYALPDGKLGLLFPHFDYISWKDTTLTIDNIKESFTDYKPEIITNDIYFKGTNSSIKHSKIRELLSEEPYPFNIIISLNAYPFEPAYKMKDHKYLLDLPRTKP